MSTFNEEDKSLRPRIKPHQKREPQLQVAGNEEDLSNPVNIHNSNFWKSALQKIIINLIIIILGGLVATILEDIVINGSSSSKIAKLVIAALIFSISSLIWAWIFYSQVKELLQRYLGNSKTFISRRVSDETIASLIAILMIIGFFIAIIIFSLFHIKCCTQLYNTPG